MLQSIVILKFLLKIVIKAILMLILTELTNAKVKIKLEMLVAKLGSYFLPMIVILMQVTVFKILSKGAEVSLRVSHQLLDIPRSIAFYLIITMRKQMTNGSYMKGKDSTSLSLIKKVLIFR